MSSGAVIDIVGGRSSSDNAMSSATTLGKMSSAAASGTTPGSTAGISSSSAVPASSSSATTSSAQSRASLSTAAPTSSSLSSDSRILDRRRLADLVKEVDPLEQLDEDVEELLMQIADDFIDNVVTASCQIAKHRKSNVVEVKDVQLHLEHNWNMWVPGFGADELRPYKKAAPSEAHKQRVALIKKVQKKL